MNNSSETTTSFNIPHDIDDYILIIKDNCNETNNLLQMAHPDIQFVCRLNEGTGQMVLVEQFEKSEGGLHFQEVPPVDGKTQLYYCERTQSQFLDNTNLKLYEYSENKFKEIVFFINAGFTKNLNGVFIKRSDRTGEPDNFPVKNSSIQLSEDDRKRYFNKMIEEYNIANMSDGGKRSSRRTSKKRPNRKRKPTKRRRGTRKRANKKR